MVARRQTGLHHFQLVAGDLVNALTTAGVASTTVAQIVAAVAPLADEITSGG